MDIMRISLLVSGVMLILTALRLGKLEKCLKAEYRKWPIKIGHDGKSGWAAVSFDDPRIANALEPHIEALVCEMVSQINQVKGDRENIH